MSSTCGSSRTGSPATRRALRHIQWLRPHLRERLHQQQHVAARRWEPRVAASPSPGFRDDRRDRFGMGDRRLFRHTGVAVLRAAAASTPAGPAVWPDLIAGPGAGRRAWLRDVWSGSGTAEAIALASPILSRRVQDVLGGTGPRRAVGPPHRDVGRVVRRRRRLRSAAAEPDPNDQQDQKQGQ